MHPAWPTDIPELVARSRREARAVYVGDDLVLCRILGLFDLFVDARDPAMLARCALDGCWEPDVTMLLRRLVQPGMKVANVGANNGYFMVLLADLVGPRGFVWAMEANPVLYRALRRSTQAGGISPWVHLEMAAAGAVEGGTVRFLSPTYGFTWGSVVRGEPPEGLEATVLTVPRRRLDAVVGDAALDLVLVDAEGSEPDVIAGMEGVFAKGRPDLLLAYTPSAYADPAAFVRGLAERGYRLSRLAGDGVLLALPAEELAAARGQCTVLAQAA